MHWEAAARTDPGLQRSGNEDAHLCARDAGVFGIADGMGGHPAGEVASRLAVQTLARWVSDGHSRRFGAARLQTLLRDTVTRANLVIARQAAENPAESGMGTTLTALALVPRDGVAVLAHVGDSRAYRLRDGTLRQITVDHTWVQQQVDAGQLTESQARVHPFSSILTRALGTSIHVDVDALEVALRPGDLLLLCSDGLTAMLEDDEIRSLLASAAPPAALATRLIDAANARGGVDNITVVLVRILD